MRKERAAEALVPVAITFCYGYKALERLGIPGIAQCQLFAIPSWKHLGDNLYFNVPEIYELRQTLSYELLDQYGVRTSMFGGWRED